MHTLRNSKLIASLVLAWFALFLGSAVASSLIKPDSMQVICAAGGGMKMVVLDVDGNEGGLKVSANMDCPLCASAAMPPTPGVCHHVKLSALAHALRPMAAAHIAAITAPPLPSRGPPPCCSES